jgi:hypothetical protein
VEPLASVHLDCLLPGKWTPTSRRFGPSEGGGLKASNPSRLCPPGFKLPSLFYAAFTRRLQRVNATKPNATAITTSMSPIPPSTATTPSSACQVELGADSAGHEHTPAGGQSQLPTGCEGYA